MGESTILITVHFVFNHLGTKEMNKLKASDEKREKEREMTLEKEEGG